MLNADLTLLREFSRSHSESAFAALVEGHVNLVHSVALRQVRDPHLAEDVTQAVFIILARKAGTLGDHTIISGWLCRVTRHVSSRALRGEWRRQQREQEAYLQSALNKPPSENWIQIAPLLDAAMEKLNRKDHDALVLRFFENKNFSEVGAALGTSEDTARMRVNRALEKLRRYFLKRGMNSTASSIAGAIAANSVQAAPAARTKSVTVAAISKGATASTLTLATETLKIMARTKTAAAITAGIVVVLAAGVTAHLWYYHFARDSWQHRLDAAYRLKRGEVIRYIPPPFIPERLTYYQTHDPRQARAIPAGPEVLAFIQDQQGRLNFGGSAFGPRQFPLWMQLRTELGFKPYEFAGPGNLLNLTVNGDWTIGEGITRDALVKALEPILWKATGHHIIFEKRTVERDVIVASGKRFAVQPRTAIQLYAENLKDDSYDGSGDLKTFFQALGTRLEIRLIDETEMETNSPGHDTVNLTWTYHHDSNANAMKNRRTELTDKLLKNLSVQTGLTFTREQRPVAVWFISEQP